MFKKFLHSKGFSTFLDGIGIFYLSSFLLNTAFLKFLVKIIPGCDFGLSLISYVECGRTLPGFLLGIYFLYFSPQAIFATPLIVFALFSPSAYGVFEFLWILSIATLLLLLFFSAIRLLIKLAKRDRIFLRQALPLILLPTLVVWGIQNYIAPPATSDRLIEIDLWHDRALVPRAYLTDWSYFKIERPANDPAELYNLGSNIGANIGANPRPYMTLALRINEIDKTLKIDDNISVNVAPYHSELSDQEIFQKREKFLERKLKETLGPYKKVFLYGNRVDKQGVWTIYKAAGSSEISRMANDIYFSRNGDGDIERLLACTPENWCEKSSGKITNFQQCKSEQECQSCTRTCADMSLGTNKYMVTYRFDKKHLPDYDKIHQGTIRFIEDLLIPKKDSSNDQK